MMSHDKRRLALLFCFQRRGVLNKCSGPTQRYIENQVPAPERDQIDAMFQGDRS